MKIRQNVEGKQTVWLMCGEHGWLMVFNISKLIFARHLKMRDLRGMNLILHLIWSLKHSSILLARYIRSKLALSSGLGSRHCDTGISYSRLSWSHSIATDSIQIKKRTLSSDSHDIIPLDRSLWRHVMMRSTC